MKMKNERRGREHVVGMNVEVMTIKTLTFRMRTVAPPGIFIGGGVKNVGVWGSARENFSLTTPSTLVMNVTNAPVIG